RVVVAVARLFGRVVAVGGAPGLGGGGGGGVAVDRDRPPLQLHQADAGDAVVEQVLVDLHQLLVMVAGGGVLHHRGVVRGDRLHLLLVGALDHLLDGRLLGRGRLLARGGPARGWARTARLRAARGRALAARRPRAG